MGRAPFLAGAEVVSGRGSMPDIFHADVPGKAADGFEPGIALRHGRAKCCPIDCGLRLDMRFRPLCRKAGKALQQVLVILQCKSCGTAQNEIGIHGFQHDSASGQGSATCFNAAISALA